MIKAVVFDIDGVLLDSFDANFSFFQLLLKTAGYSFPTKETFVSLNYLTMRGLIETLTHASEKEVDRIWEMGRSDTVAYPYNLLRVQKDAAEVVKQLHENYLLGIVTSRVREGIYAVPSLAKLEQYFQATVAAQDTKEHKPHPEPLLLACKKLKVAPDEAVYIGDAASDIIAGKAAGMKTIAYAKKRLENSDAWVDSFIKLPEVIATL